jgi:hypothetical protein
MQSLKRESIRMRICNNSQNNQMELAKIIFGFQCLVLLLHLYHLFLAYIMATGYI